MKKLFLFLSVSSCIHTYSINSDLYTMADEIEIKAMDSAYRLRINGYYQRITSKVQKFVPAPFYFVLYEDGYFLDCGSPELWNQRKGRWKWGKFRIVEDTIRIQYYTYATSNVGFAGIFSAKHSLYAQEFQGKITSDSTMNLLYVKYHDVVDLRVLPIREEKFDPPLEYHFVQYPSLPEPKNWLREEEQKKK